MRIVPSGFLKRLSALVAWCGVAWVSPAWCSAAAKAVEETPAATSETASLRVVEQKGKSIALEIASTEFARPDGTGPRVALVGVAHIADQSFFDQIATLLEAYDVVLYESVKPPGTGGAGGETHEQKVESTKSAMQFVVGIIEAHHAQHQSYPVSLDSLRTFAESKDARMVQFLNTALLDGWGQPLVYGTTIEAENRATAYALTSLGADGKPGGKDEAADITVSDLPAPEPLAMEQDDGLQAQLAAALNLKFQLDALPYDAPNWRCSDMAMDELNRRFADKGLDFGVIGGSLAGTSLPATLIKLVLGFIKMLDAVAEGAITDTFKVIMIEMLGDPTLLDTGLQQLGKGFGEIIVNDRNQVVIDDLKKIVEKEPNVKSIALLYGAAHMPDMAERMRTQMGYEPLPAETTRWLPAISVDLTQSKVSPAQIETMRRMVKQAIRQQLRRPKAVN